MCGKWDTAAIIMLHLGTPGNTCVLILDWHQVRVKRSAEVRLSQEEVKSGMVTGMVMVTSEHVHCTLENNCSIHENGQTCK